MCSLTMGLLGASTALSAIGAKQQGDAEAALAEQNARNAERMAIDAERRGAEAGYAAYRQGRDVLGAQQVAMAANWVDSSSGSMADLLANTAAGAAYDALLANNNAQREAYGYRVDAANSRTRASIAKAAGRNKAAATLLTGGLQGYGVWKKKSPVSLDPLGSPFAATGFRNLTVKDWSGRIS